MRSLFVIAALSASALALPAFVPSASAQVTPPGQSPATTPGETMPGQSAAGQPAQGSVAPQSDASTKQVCKTFTPAGTRFSKKECHTQAEWDQMSADARSSLSGAGEQRSGPH